MITIILVAIIVVVHVIVIPGFILLAISMRHQMDQVTITMLENRAILLDNYDRCHERRGQSHGGGRTPIPGTHNTGKDNPS